MENNTETPEASSGLPVDLTAANPVQIDTALAELFEQAERAGMQHDASIESLHSWVGDRKVRFGRHKDWALTDDEVLAKATELARSEDYKARYAAQQLAKITESNTRLRVLNEQMEPLNAEFHRRGWSRFFAVPGGHIHSSMDCSTCNHRGKATRFGWIPAMSGRTEAECVAEHGALLCTVCFPSAPVEWTNHYEVEEARKKAESCPGSGTYLDRDKPHRTGFYSGNWATCPGCDGQVAVTSTGKLRKHKPSG